MKKLFIVLFTIGSFSTTEALSQDLNTFFDEADAFFQGYVSGGKVDYKSIHANTKQLDAVLALAKSISVPKSEAKAYQAFWINAYNLSVIKGIVDNYPLKSPLDKKGFFDTTTYELGSSKITLNDIENKKLRANFNEPRFHFVLVCGALGCPPIIPMAYTPSNLEYLLQQQTVKALNNSEFVRVSNKKVAFSEIFKWYKEDFTKEGSEIDFLNKFRKEPVPANAKVTYYAYDWRLNSI
ncbi:DUF547 domain-containing protein [Rasiella rasia]|uniref:DUF547 domain-containing protein n=1 Tax=Rasiella rasia TaxID=2744027 RepID=A0A6G6GLM6_9FLAO|nr:DUF547 domain-containing protein [Rasiella rasia]QIE59424.1 DUF547 domain-containing protein [Rasiella rasia]